MDNQYLMLFNYIPTMYQTLLQKILMGMPMVFNYMLFQKYALMQGLSTCYFLVLSKLSH